jgi:hypothetical protein
MEGDGFGDTGAVEGGVVDRLGEGDAAVEPDVSTGGLEAPESTAATGVGAGRRPMPIPDRPAAATIRRRATATMAANRRRRRGAAP